MTLFYNLFGIPGTVSEFLDGEKKKYGSEVKIKLERELRSSGNIFPDDFRAGIYLCSMDDSRSIQVKKYRGHYGPVRNEVPEIERRIDEDKSELMSKIKGMGFVVFDAHPLASLKKTPLKKNEQSEASSSPHNQPEIERQHHLINPWDIDFPKIEDRKLGRNYGI